jgi:hypothetical protein
MSTRGNNREMVILVSVALAVPLLAGLPFGAVWLREPVAARTEPLPLSFPHSKHTKNMGCAVCHHNVTDNDMAGMPCIHCHKSDHPKLVRGIEGEFHDLCKGCHAKEARLLEDHGPVRECKGCHVATVHGFMP